MLHCQVPSSEDKELVSETGELNRGVVLSEIIDCLLGELGLDKVEAITQPEVRNVIVHEYSHLFSQFLRYGCEIAP